MKNTPRQPGDDLQPHASEERKAKAWPRSNREIGNETFLCGYWGHIRSDGELCRAHVVEGTKSCYRHSGITLAAAKAKGAIVMELKRWGLDREGELADPGLVLLQLVAQSADRVRIYSALVAEAAGLAEAEVVQDALHDLMRQNKTVAALIGYRYGVDREGNRFAVERVIDALVQLEGMERDRCANFATKAIAAGLAERQVRLAEQQGTLIVGLLRRVADRMNFTPEQMTEFAMVAAEELREIAA